MRKMSSVLLSSKKIPSESKKNSLILPPGVDGKLYGFCTLTIREINWTTTRTFNLVKIRVHWWGDKQGSTFEGIRGLSSKKRLKSSAELARNKPLLSICYHINTNYRLFQSYLKNCEPLAIEIFSSKTSDLIGTASLPVSSRLHNILTENLSCSFSSDIVTPRNFKLGVITTAFDIKMHSASSGLSTILHSIKTPAEKDDDSKAIAVTEAPSRRQLKSAKIGAQNESNKENIKVIGRKKTILFREQKPLKPSTLKPASSKRSSINLSSKSNTSSSKSIITTKSASSSTAATSSISDKQTSTTASREPLKSNSSRNMRKLSLINYLSGQPMSRHEEDKVLTEIIQFSPSQSVIEEINKINQKPKPPPPQTAVNSDDDIDTLQINLHSLELNEIGSHEVKNYCNKLKNAKFIFKCALTSKLLKAKDLNIVSPVFDDLPSKKTIFNRQLVQRVRIDRENAAVNTYLNFGFCIQSIECDTAPQLIGFTRVHMADIIANKMRYCRKCAVIDEYNLAMGAVFVSIQIGKRRQNLADFNYRCNERILNEPSEIIHRPYSSKVLQQIVNDKVTTHPSTSNDDCGNQSERHYESKNMQTDLTETNSKLSRKESYNVNDNRDTEMIDVEIKENKKTSKVYQGLFFVEALRSIKDQSSHSEYFVTYEGFWNECQESSELSFNWMFNYLKQFPVMCDEEFLKRVQNNHMELKLWEKTGAISEKLIGTTKVPLHQFYIAFKDAEMIEHLSTNKLPIISTDAWCNFISPLSSELFCQVKILLAIGSEHQIDYLKFSRNLTNLPALQRSNSATNTNAQLKSKLTAFIESLSQKLPEPTAGNSNHAKLPSSYASSSSSSIVSPKSQPQLRKTSDLLDTLQKALAQPLPANADPFSLLSDRSSPSREVSFNQSLPLLNDRIRIQVSIEQAANLPKVIVKKCRNKRKSKGTPPQRQEYEPLTYATFEAVTDHLNEKSLPLNAIKSHEGIVYCTPVVKSCNPEWNQNFQVFIKFDVIKNPQKKFVVKIWRKGSHNPTKIEAAPFEDSVIGFTAIDLSVLLTGLPILAGFYNIVDFSGRCNGQLKISLKPLDDVMKFRNAESPLVPPQLMCPLNIDVNNSSESSSDGSTLLSRTLKRKFTELDEITQRLRARLFDVTGDEHFDPDEEFERDLNTAVDDEDDDGGGGGFGCDGVDDKEDFGWLKKDINMGATKNMESQEPSSSKNSAVLTRRDTGTGCSSSDDPMQQQAAAPFAIDDLLKKYDLDTLINPNIFKNLLDPNLANSDSTPTLVPKAPDDANERANDSDVTTVSSISNDQVQTIQKALQRTSLHDQSTPRKDPDGHNNASE